MVPMRPEDVPQDLIDLAMTGAKPCCRGDAAFYLANVLPHHAAMVRDLDAPRWAREIAETRQQAIRDLDGGRITDEELAAAGLDTGHIVDLRYDGWTIRHPLSCRPHLFECPVNLAGGRDLTEPPDELGRFVCGVDDDGRLVISHAAGGASGA